MSAWLQAAADGWWDWIVPLALQAALACALILVLDGALARRAAPAVRAAAWWALLIKLLVPVSLQSTLVVVPMVHASALGSIDAGAPTRFVLFVVWILGVVFAASGSIWRWRASRREWLGCTLDAPPWLVALARGTARTLGSKRAPPIRLHPRACTAAVLGFWRPVVVIPLALARVERKEQLEHVLLHELAHVRRRDPIASLLVQSVQIAYWFHPAAWLARTRLAELRELACDEIAAGRVRCGAGAYRRTLLELSRALVVRSTFAPNAFMHTHAQILTRLSRLERPLSPQPARNGALALALFAAVLATCAPLGQRPAQATATPFAELPGCLQKRYVVLAALAAEERRD